jgi:hypothetical protein
MNAAPTDVTGPKASASFVKNEIAALSDKELLARTALLASRERATTADLIEHLAEVDLRRLWLDQRYDSMFDYCVRALRFSEDAAFKRIRAARAVNRFRIILEMLRDGRLTLAAVCLLHPFLDEPDATALIVGARGLTVREIERMLAERRPRGQRRDVMRFVGSPPLPPSEPPVNPTEGGLPFADTAPPLPAPPVPTPRNEDPRASSPRLVRFAFTADEDFYRLLERVRALMRHKYPDGRLDGVLRDALQALLARKDLSVRWAPPRRRRLGSKRPDAAGAKGRADPGPSA